MGQGGKLILINGTPYAWELTYEHSYQMKSWPFKDFSTIPAYSSVSIYVEWVGDIFEDVNDDSGDATYILSGTSYSFQIQARWRFLQVQLQTMATVGNAQGSTIGLGWKHNGVIPFILSGSEGGFSSSNPPSAWMQSNIARLGPHPLRHLCIPGSHDSGMYRLTGGTAFSNTSNTITQTFSIGDQLNRGVRYFDCRPVLSGRQYVSGHYSDLAHPLGWQGGNGEFFVDIVSQINNFTNSNKELIIFNLSHDRNTSAGRDYKAFNQEEWDNLFELLMGINHLYVASNPDTVDLTLLPLGEFIGNGEAAVVVIIQPDDNTVTLGNYANLGFYTYAQLDAYNSYSNTEHNDEMSRDQLQKMREVRTDPDAQWFLLSWTLTLNAASAVTGVPTILELAQKAAASLYTDVYSACTPATYPNILYLDAWQSSDPTALAMAINDTVNEL
ncbi:hypothetical protein IEO21_04308 [Rhodonia placenta]|uniref:PLC-like phosphodiesterase n=1 Tax=Rhodonia placenta TaxID=104341 RepID=A0A8H7U2M8_9APHY|nr:hypothetical protein IEO21_04308 [Postia placenta]